MTYYQADQYDHLRYETARRMQEHHETEWLRIQQKLPLKWRLLHVVSLLWTAPICAVLIAFTNIGALVALVSLLGTIIGCVAYDRAVIYYNPGGHGADYQSAREKYRLWARRAV